jgi:hypothetical protein
MLMGNSQVKAHGESLNALTLVPHQLVETDRLSWLCEKQLERAV